MHLAEKLGMPVITFLDTAGAFPGPAAEERGQAEAIATSIKLMTGLQVPIVVVVLGEGGSGGALAIGVGDVVLALENAVYSVISPEGCASILWRDPEKAPVAAAAMRMTAADQLELGVIDAIIDEPKDGAQHDPAATARSVKAAIVSNLQRISRVEPEALLTSRYARLRSIGLVLEAEGEAAPLLEPVTLRGRIGRLLRIPGVPNRRGGARSGRVVRMTARTRVTIDRSRRRARADCQGRQGARTRADRAPAAERAGGARKSAPAPCACEWRSARMAAGRRQAQRSSPPAPEVPARPGRSPEPAAAAAAGKATHGVTSPAVGFFAYADGLGPGLPVDKGDALGHVEMLGVRHDVRAPRSGTVRNLVTEAGEPVEYGQLLIELEPVE